MSIADAAKATAAWERPAFFDGQGLTAGDLTQAQRYQREMRWLHNRSLHGWGVVEGLAVAGAKGKVEVTVVPGYALDWLGRELIIASPRTLAVPALSGGRRYLTLSYIDDSEQTPVEARAGGCGGSGSVRLAEGAELRWRDPGDSAADTAYQPGLHVLLATVTIKECTIAGVSLAGRREARASLSPHVHAGATPAGATAWTLWHMDGTSTILGVQTDVDTSIAGFSGPPRYTAQVVGRRTLAQQGAIRVLDGFARVDAPGATGFTLRVMMPRGLGVGMDSLNPAALLNASLPGLVGSTLDWHVNWLGIEG
jgi:hypothetical protein